MKFSIFKKKEKYPKDFPEINVIICEKVNPHTMTGKLRLNALIDSVKYVVKNNIEGSIVECGVWKGGSTMAIALTLVELGINDRDLFLYDTFGGMTKPGKEDISHKGDYAESTFNKLRTSEDSSNWCFSPLDEVKRNMESTFYNNSKIHYIKGPVEKTIPFNIPKKISILRLDTDWYESTKHELVHLFPLLSKNGILIIDDYGYWKGARKAVDEYFEEQDISVFLNRIDHTGRLVIKTS